MTGRLLTNTEIISIFLKHAKVSFTSGQYNLDVLLYFTIRRCTVIRTANSHWAWLRYTAEKLQQTETNIQISEKATTPYPLFCTKFQILHLSVLLM